MTTINAVFSVAALALMAVLFWIREERVAVFDKKALTKHFITQLAEHRVKDEKISETTLKFKRALRESLDFYRASHPHQLVLRKEAVAFGGADITDTIAGRVAQTMKRAS
ncbi:F pilus extension/retraction protein TrbI Inner membrane protein [Legionella donaldsonii]|uniref:F pilus extension/retraction protein TrbI Inner membrane protein n=1 Tax=Legionella donaldsonii TaxID=45060 RepID=A0A378J071_9GAMM|nr:TrbI F-type domain-containing protein [Legionella donaldsonii]STX41113.1 F pilus extension/retraction protein TrbI Inner membrane protein [Legionella donaldsonii]